MDTRLRMFLAGFAGFGAAILVIRALAIGGTHLAQTGDLMASIVALWAPSAASGLLVAASLLVFVLLRRPQV
jgi:hypothetical protein